MTRGRQRPAGGAPGSARHGVECSRSGDRLRSWAGLAVAGHRRRTPCARRGSFSAGGRYPGAQGPAPLPAGGDTTPPAPAIRHGSGSAAVRTSTSAMDSIGRSGDRSCDAPFTTHGFRPMSSSATSVAWMPLSSRYAFAAVTGCFRAKAAFQDRTVGGVIFPRCRSPKAGRMWHRRRGQADTDGRFRAFLSG